MSKFNDALFVVVRPNLKNKIIKRIFLLSVFIFQAAIIFAGSDGSDVVTIKNWPATQNVAIPGGISVAASTEPITIANFPPQISTVSVVNFPTQISTVSVVNFQPQISTVSVVNFPAQISTVSVVNFPTQVSTVSVTNFPAQISTASIVNLPAITTVTFNGASQSVNSTSVNVATVSVSGNVTINSPSITGSVVVTAGTGTWTTNSTSVNLTTVTFNGTSQPVTATISGTPSVNSTSVNLTTVTFNNTAQPVTATISGVPTVSASISGTSNTVVAAQSGTWNVNNTSVNVATITISGTPSVAQSGTWNVNNTSVNVATVTQQYLQPTTLSVSSAGAAGSVIVASMSAVASQYHYIDHIEIVMYSTGTRVGAAAPVTVTTSNLPGNPSFTFPTAAAVGTQVSTVYEPATPIKSTVLNTGTTITCPATVAVIWRVNVFYWTGT